MDRIKLFSLFIGLALLSTSCSAITPAAGGTQPATGGPKLPVTPTRTLNPATPTATVSQQQAATSTNTPAVSATTPAATLGPTPSGGWIRLTPERGAPGTTVQIDGYISNGPTQAEIQADQALSFVTVCWQSCFNGFVEQEQNVVWSASPRGSFRTQFTIPAVPWLGPNGAQPLANGDFTISLQCLGPQHGGCATLEGNPSAVFHLEGSVSTQCQPGQPCASLFFSPARATPGAQVQVTGWAPISGLAAGQPIPYSLVLQIPNQTPFELGSIHQDAAGNVTGGFKVPQQIPGLGNLQPGSYLLALQPLQLTKSGSSPQKVAATSFEISAAFTWTSLKLGAPLWIEPSASLFAPQVTVDPANPLRLAYCAAGQIELSTDGGRKWTGISTAGVVNALADTPYVLGVSQTPDQVACSSLTLDPKHADSYFAVFQTTNKNMGAPPMYWMGLSTSDAGNVWKLVPPPANSSAEQFGGFWTGGQGVVQALFSGAGNGPEQSPPVLAQQTDDGGKTWSAASLACPSGGPCIRWNGAPGSVGGMGAQLPQWVMVSIDGGSNWMAPGPTVELREQGPNELAAFSDKIAILLAGNGEYPLRVTQDGGQSWSAISLPPAHGADPTNSTFPGLQILPDGSLLAQAADGKSWSLLMPGAPNWCPLTNSGLPAETVLLRAAGNVLWWQNPADLKVNSLPSSQLRCGQ